MNYAVHYRLIEQLIEDPQGVSFSKDKIAQIVNPGLREAEETGASSREE